MIRCDCVDYFCNNVVLVQVVRIVGEAHAVILVRVVGHSKVWLAHAATSHAQTGCPEGHLNMDSQSVLNVGCCPSSYTLRIPWESNKDVCAQSVCVHPARAHRRRATAPSLVKQE